MSEQTTTKPTHTPGRVFVDHCFVVATDGQTLADTQMDGLSEQQQEYNAVHFSDCWNAILDSGLDPAEVGTLKQQRDEAVECCLIAKTSLIKMIDKGDCLAPSHVTKYLLDKLSSFIANATAKEP